MFRMYEQYSSEIRFSELEDPDESWELIDLIGEGTYGEVYSAKHKQTGQVAAVKILESIHEIIEEIEIEYLILRDYNDHTNMPRFYGLYLKKGQTGSDDQLWMVMEQCTRGSVTDLAKSLIDKGLTIDEMLLAFVLKETLRVLLFLHKNHIVHRDVKGHNILITDKGHIKLIDFGVSGRNQSTLDKKKTSVGTPYWMAPEVIACERQLDYSYDIRCDVWSLGITAIELMDGQPPLSDKHPMRALFRIPRNPPPKMKNPDQWSGNCRDFIAKCLTKDYEERPFVWDLLNHPFIAQVPDNVAELREKLVFLSAQIERIIHEPDVTTKQGRLKSRKSRQGPPQTTDDLTQLEVLEEESIVAQLFTRYTQSLIYTYIGDILLAVNPFTPLTIYGEEHARRYVNAAKGDNPPHIYAIADQAYQMLVHQKKHQCIVISGESGAGKTESANFLVQQLTQLGKAPNRDLEEKILQVNPLMEAFGNARTVINDNSSRFGKYLEMFFTENGTVTGAKITEYLLEKSRVIYQAPKEQNFHIFYYVHDGLPSEDKNHKYHLKENATYRYISEHAGSTPDVVTLNVNRVKFKAIQHCFNIIGFKQEEVASIFGVIAAILHTGNIEFDEKSTSHASDGVMVANTDLTNTVAELLGLEASDLVEVLTTSGMVARGEVIIRENSLHEALDVRDAMSKSLYGRLFSWIVNKINVLLQPDKTVYKEESLNIVGLLDIFGFENFPTNSFEQLCINIANEQIQYYFNQHIFAWELQEYRNEGVDGSVITFVDNRPLLDMFLQKPMGLLALLDEESHFPKATDWTLVEKFHQNIKGVHYSRPKATSSSHFTIDHYAGKVRYDTTGFLEKNRDRLPIEVVNLLRASDNSVVRSLFQTPLTKTGNLASGTMKSGVSSASTPSSTSTAVTFASVQSLRSQTSSMGGSRGSTATSMTRIQQTVATYFRFSLMDLLAKMVAGSPHFVRCIRPNEENIPDQFDSKKVMTQLRYTGVLETTRIRREGYSHRILFTEFVKRYSLLALGDGTALTPDKRGCETLLNRLQLTDWALGKTKVFLKFYHVELLARRYAEVQRRIVTIQAAARMVVARNRFYERKWQLEKVALSIQKHVRGWLVRRQYRKMFVSRRLAAVFVQKVYRGYMTRKRVCPEMAKQRAAVLRIQTMYRGYRARQEARQQRQVREIEERQRQERAAGLIQKVFRSRKTQKLAEEAAQRRVFSRDDAALVIQTYYRMWKCRQVYKQLLKYKGKKELQLIYFTQQVEEYSKDSERLFRESSHPAKPVPLPGDTPTVVQAPPSSNQAPPSPKLATASTSAAGEATDNQKKGRRKRLAPAVPPEPVSTVTPDVGEERLEHMRKMKRVKTLLPDTEMLYYRNLNEYSDVEEDEADAATTSTSANRKKKAVMTEDAESYYSSIAKKSAALNETRNDQVPLGETAASMTSKKPVSDWDAPLQHARDKMFTARLLLDEGLHTPPSPPMQISPYSLLSPAYQSPQTLTGSLDMPFDASYSKTSSSPLAVDTALLTQANLNPSNDKAPYIEAYSSLLTNKSPAEQDKSTPDTINAHNLHSSTHFEPMDQLELSSETASVSSTNQSVTSHELALNMLDHAIETSAAGIDLSLSPATSELGAKARSPSSDPRTRDLLARNVAEQLLANKPRSPWQLTLEMVEPRWDAPLRSLTRSSNCSSPESPDPSDMLQQNLNPVIEDDPKTDREEFYEESDKDELVYKLKEEYRKSAKGKWNLLQKLVTSGNLLQKYSRPGDSWQEYSVHNNEDEHTLSNGIKDKDHVTHFSTNQNQRPPTPPSNRKTVIAVHHGKQNGFFSHQNGNHVPPKQAAKVKFATSEPTVIGGSRASSINSHGNSQHHQDNQHDPHDPASVNVNSPHSNAPLSSNNNRTGHQSAPNENSPNFGFSSNDVSSLDSFNYRAMLKRTDIDPEQLRHDPHDDTDKPIYDFRKMLRKTGRLERIAGQSS